MGWMSRVGGRQPSEAESVRRRGRRWPYSLRSIGLEG
jgi:hypothetical protein